MSTSTQTMTPRQVEIVDVFTSAAGDSDARLAAVLARFRDANQEEIAIALSLAAQREEHRLLAWHKKHGIQVVPLGLTPLLPRSRPR